MQIYLDTRRAVRRWLLRSLQPCRELVPLMSESLERRLSFIERLKLRLHLLVCIWCARYFKQIKFLTWLVRQPAADSNEVKPIALSAEARERISESLRQ